MTVRRLTAAALLAGLMIPALWSCNCPDPPPPPPPPGITVQLIADCDLDPGNAHLNRAPDKSNHIRWHNQTDVQQTVAFDESMWPFMEAYQEIVVDPGRYSAWFTVDEAGVMGLPQGYKVTPLIGPECPPAEPSITTDP